MTKAGGADLEAAKLCALCGEDVRNRSRVKLPSNEYRCRACDKARTRSDGHSRELRSVGLWVIALLIAAAATVAAVHAASVPLPVPRAFKAAR